MSDTPKTDAFKRTVGQPWWEFAGGLERELAASQAGQAMWQAEAARLSAEREHNANMAGMWRALAEGLASRLNLWHNAAGNRCNVQDAAALAAYEAAKAGGAGAGLAVDSVALARALLETRDIQVYGDGCSTQERDTWILAKMIDTALAAKTGKPCKTCGGSKMTDGWYPTYNDPDNSGMHPEAEPCPDCQSVKLPDPLAEAVKRCDWKEDEDGNWYTACHQFMSFEYAPPNEQGYKFCHRCGHPISFVEFAPRLD